MSRCGGEMRFALWILVFAFQTTLHGGHIILVNGEKLECDTFRVSGDVVHYELDDVLFQVPLKYVDLEATRLSSGDENGAEELLPSISFDIGQDLKGTDDEFNENIAELNTEVQARREAISDAEEGAVLDQGSLRKYRYQDRAESQSGRFRRGYNTYRLTYAIRANDWDRFEECLNNGVPLEHDVPGFEQPLALAAQCKRFEMAEELIRSGANVNLYSSDNRSLLMFFIQQNAPESLLKELIASGVHVSAQDVEGNTAAHYAARFGRLEVLDGLYDRGMTRFTDRNQNGTTALDIALSRSDLEIAEYLIRHSGAPLSTSPDFAELICAMIAKGEFRLYEALADTAVSLNIRDSIGRTPLSAACKIGNIMLVEDLLARGASPSFLDQDGRSPLEIAVANKNDVIEEILTNHASTEKLDPNLLLARAVESGNASLAREAIERGADPDLRVGDQAALIRAIAQDDDDLVDALLDGGADASKRSDQGELPYSLVRESDNGKRIRARLREWMDSK